MLIAIASDHAGFDLKEKIKKHLESCRHKVADLGPFDDKSSDYPDYAKLLADNIAQGKSERGVLVCGSGIGMCMAANRINGVRAVVLHDEIEAKMSRTHNDANVACFGARRTSAEDALKFLDVFLATAFEGGRHAIRVAKIDTQNQL